MSLHHKYNCKCVDCEHKQHKSSCQCLDCCPKTHEHNCVCNECKPKHKHNCACNSCHPSNCLCKECKPKHSHNCQCSNCKKHSHHCKCSDCIPSHDHHCQCSECKPPHHHHCNNCEPQKNDCTHRNFINHNDELRHILGDLQYKKAPCLPTFNSEELKYQCHHYNGEFHKGLTHGHTTGSLTNTHDYKKMVKALVNNDQQLLSTVPLNPGAQMLLANPLASLSSPLIGAPQQSLYLTIPPSLSSVSGASDMVENYSMMFVRDVSFTNYNTDPNIALLLDSSHMNNPDILTNLLYKPTGTFGPKTLFRGISNEELVGPYVSQMLLLNVPVGGGIIMPQKYLSLAKRNVAVGRIEWGTTNTETITMQNTLINLLPPLNQLDTTHTYIYNGRALGEAVHNDVAYQFYYQSAQILTKLGAHQNPGFPTYPNQSSFITGSSSPCILTAIGEVTELSLKHAWYWKWQVYRKLRPEVFGLWIDNVKSGLVTNIPNYDISNVVLNNNILNVIHPIYNSYTLAQCYREGSPTHPSYPAGHAVCAGANCTLLKIFYDGNQSWSSLTGVIAGSLAPIAGPVQADITGINLISYIDGDAGNMTVGGEINKLASNVSLGRDWAGVHYRSDSIGGMLLGEEIAIKYMEDMLSAGVENYLDGSAPAITFKKFDGSLYTVRPTLCK